MCLCIEAFAVVSETLSGLLIIFNQWRERMALRCLWKQLIGGVSVSLLSFDCVDLSVSVAQPMLLCQWGGGHKRRE